MDSSPDHMAIMCRVVPDEESLIAFIEKTPWYSGFDDEQLAAHFGRALFQAQIDTMRARVDPARPTIGLYAPLKAFRKHFGTLSERLEAAGYTVFRLYGQIADDAFEQADNAYFAGLGMMHQLDFLDAVVITTLCADLPDRPIPRVIMLHDVFDSPLGDPRDFLELVRTMDYVFVPSEPSMAATKRVFTMFDQAGVAPLKPVQLVPMGYPRLDANRRAFAAVAREEKTLVYAPTMTLESWQEYASVARWGRGIIDTLRQSFPDHTVIFRPHPNSHTNPAVAALMQEVADLPGCEVDAITSDYMTTYGRARMLVTDMSGTAFTFAFTTGRPVVFFSPNDAAARAANPDVTYFQLRDRVGLVAECLEDLPTRVRAAMDPAFQAHAAELCRQTIYNLGASEDRFLDLLPTVLRKEILPGAFLFDPNQGGPTW
ncbi:CDP-glycerol glycerophosphotransferase family protein [Paramagnetospirillum marisnigri]|nr:CDP-glycerol glycerophosphotransferase family protein [Paramagnetospirillum marisnigri]